MRENGRKRGRATHRPSAALGRLRWPFSVSGSVCAGRLTGVLRVSVRVLAGIHGSEGRDSARVRIRTRFLSRLPAVLQVLIFTGFGIRHFRGPSDLRRWRACLAVYCATAPEKVPQITIAILIIAAKYQFKNRSNLEFVVLCRSNFLLRNVGPSFAMQVRGPMICLLSLVGRLVRNTRRAPANRKEYGVRFLSCAR